MRRAYVPPNQHAGRGSNALSEACHQRARELAEPKQRTQEERRELVRDTIDLLHAAGCDMDYSRFDPIPGHEESAAKAQRRFARVFTELHDRVSQKAREHVAQRAFGLAKRMKVIPDAELRWTNLLYGAAASHAGLLALLEAIDSAIREGAGN